jgi:hypothetical protein
MKNLELKEQAKQLRLQGVSIKQISVQLKVAKSTASLWTNGITLTPEQKQKLLTREITDERSTSRSNYFRMKRQSYQDKGKIRICQNEPLYVAGCMLYWGEGSKDINTCRMTNSELPMLLTFKKFLIEYFNVSNQDLTLKVNAYTDLHSQEDIEKFWLNGLDLPQSCLRKSLWNQYPKSSKNVARKLEYGTCALLINKTEIVQEILGAIQEFGKFENEKWLG